MTGVASFGGILALCGVFVGAHFCHRFTIQIQRRWKALSAGVAIAYVFVNVFPELEEHRSIVASTAAGTLLDAEKRIYLWALAGFIAFAGLGRLQFIQPTNGTQRRDEGIVYWGTMAGWAIYLLLIGYLLLHRDDSSMVSLWLFVSAMGLHIFMVDNQLSERFEGLYEPWGRLLLMFCLLVGWGMGAADALPESLTSRLFAFVVGGVVITSAHEEESFERSGRFWWFAGGASAYAVLLLLI